MATDDSPVSGVSNGFHDEELSTPLKPGPPSDVPLQTAKDGVPKVVDEVLYSDVCLRIAPPTPTDESRIDWCQHVA